MVLFRFKYQFLFVESDLSPTCLQYSSIFIKSATVCSSLCLKTLSFIVKQYIRANDTAVRKRHKKDVFQETYR